jgi:hypothetical protein
VQITVTGGGTTATGSSDAAITRDTPTGPSPALQAAPMSCSRGTQ